MAPKNTQDVNNVNNVYNHAAPPPQQPYWISPGNMVVQSHQTNIHAAMGSATPIPRPRTAMLPSQQYNEPQSPCMAQEQSLRQPVNGQSHTGHISTRQPQMLLQQSHQMRNWQQMSIGTLPNMPGHQMPPGSFSPGPPGQDGLLSPTRRPAMPPYQNAAIYAQPPQMGTSPNLHSQHLPAGWSNVQPSHKGHLSPTQRAMVPAYHGPASHVQPSPMGAFPNVPGQETPAGSHSSLQAGRNAHLSNMQRPVMVQHQNPANYAQRTPVWTATPPPRSPPASAPISAPAPAIDSASPAATHPVPPPYTPTAPSPWSREMQQLQSMLPPQPPSIQRKRSSESLTAQPPLPPADATMRGPANIPDETPDSPNTPVLPPSPAAARPAKRQTLAAENGTSTPPPPSLAPTDARPAKRQALIAENGTPRPSPPSPASQAARPAKRQALAACNGTPRPPPPPPPPTPMEALKRLLAHKPTENQKDVFHKMWVASMEALRRAQNQDDMEGQMVSNKIADELTLYTLRDLGSKSRQEDPEYLVRIKRLGELDYLDASGLHQRMKDNQQDFRETPQLLARAYGRCQQLVAESALAVPSGYRDGWRSYSASAFYYLMEMFEDMHYPGMEWTRDSKGVWTHQEEFEARRNGGPPRT